MTDPSHRAAARLLADSLQEMADACRSGKVPLWAIRAVAGSVAMIRHVLMGPRGRLANVIDLAPWRDPGTGAENAAHLVEIGALRREP